eukprot:96032_1
MEDINQHYEQLRRLLVKLGYPHSVDKERICNGITTELLPLLHYGLLSHSKLLASFILDSGYDLYQKNDLRFTEGIYKLLRKEFKHNPMLQCSQFLTDKGFAKRKIQFVVKCLQLGITKHNELTKKKKLQTQSKTPWNQTNLAKKVTKIIKRNQNKAAASNVVAHAKKPPKIIKKKVALSYKPPREIIATPTEQQEDPLLVNMNESLTADEMRCDLPQPIMMQTNDQTDDMSDEQDKPNELEEEEKAMEISNEALYNEPPQQQPSQTVTIDAVESVDQSMQIPQHQYDMNLIPEYDPTKYAMQNEEDAIKEIKRSNEHYSGSYLDTYSTLMDIPSTFLNTELQNDDNNSDHKQQNQDSESTEEEEDDDEEDHEPSEDEDDPDENTNNDDSDREDGEDKKESDTVQNENASDVNNAIKTIMDRLDHMESKMEKQFETIGARLTILEGKIKFVQGQQISQSQTTQSSSNGTSLPSSSTNTGPVKSSSGVGVWSEHKEYDHPTFTASTIGSSSLPVSLTPAPQRNRVVNAHNDRNVLSKTMPRSNHTQPVVSSTISNRYISSINQHPKHIHAPTAKSPFIGDMHLNTRSYGGAMNRRLYGSSTTQSSLYPHTMMRPPHREMLRYPLSSSASDRNEMKSNGSGVMSNNGSLSIPKIQSVTPLSSSTSHGHSSSENNDPNSTLNFINELKDMLKSTDELLKSKPITLYDSNI